MPERYTRPLLWGLLILSLTGCAGLERREAEGPDATAKSDLLLLEQAREAQGKGHLQEALTKYQLVLDRQPSHTRANIGAGEVLLELHWPARALARFDAALKQSPDSVVALEGRGYALLGLRRLPEAEATLQRVVNLNPGRWRAWSSLGVLADLRGDHATAQTCFDKALLVLPGHPLLLNNRAFSLMMLGQFAKAEPLLREALGHDPESGRIRNNLAWCLVAQRRYEDALKILAPHFPPAQASNNIGYIAMQQGDYPAAMHYFNQALEQSAVFYERAANNLSEVQRRIEQAAGE